MDLLYKSSPVDTAQNELRLVTISADSTPSHVSCVLETFSLDDRTPTYQEFLASNESSGKTLAALRSEWMHKNQPLTESRPSKPVLAFPNAESHRFQWGDYAALSYAWGDPDDKVPIYVNAIEVQVTRNLATILASLAETSQFTGRFRLWIDALCIDQSNNIERSEQVAVMRTFYSGAWSVISFLGLEADGSTKALRLLAQLAEISDNDEACVTLRENLMQGQNSHELGSWLALDRLLLRPYWERLWIMQELALGGSWTVIWCGSEQITWQTFCRGIGVIHMYLWAARHYAIDHDRRHLDPSDESDSTPQLMHIWKDLWLLTQTQEQGLPSPALGRLLEIANSCECSDARDKVYGLLGIMDLQLAPAIVPDYTRSLATAFTTTAQAYISTYGDLELLREANLWGPAGAPSWVPDWSWVGRGRDSRPDDSFQFDWDDASLERRSYRADGGTVFVAPEYRGTDLVCNAVIFDYVDGLGSHPEAGITEIVQSQGQESAYADPGEAALQLGTALYADRRRRAGHSSALLHLPRDKNDARLHFARLGWTSFLGDLIHYHRWVIWFGSNARLIIGGRELQDYSAGVIPEGADEQDFWTAHHGWVRTCLAGPRRLVTTTSGRFGWAPCARGVPQGERTEVQRGDAFAIFPGCSTPILLRPTGDDGRFRVIGECYVHGMMGGEISSLLEQTVYKLQKVYLC